MRLFAVTAVLCATLAFAADSAKSGRIYVYAPRAQKVQVTVEPGGGVQTWSVTATSRGALAGSWEGPLADPTGPLTEGFCVARGELADFLDSILQHLGLSQPEIIEFKAHWLPKLAVKPYTAIRFLSREEIDRAAPLKVKPQPDSVIRVSFDFRALDREAKLTPQRMPPAKRAGFAVVEWSGPIYKD